MELFHGRSTAGQNLQSNALSRLYKYHFNNPDPLCADQKLDSERSPEIRKVPCEILLPGINQAFKRYAPPEVVQDKTCQVSKLASNINISKMKKKNIKSTIPPRKLTVEEFNKLSSVHIHDLSEEDLVSLCFTISCDIYDFKKSDWEISFQIRNATSKGFAECVKNSNMRIGRTNRNRDGMSSLVSWGGCFSFRDMVTVLRKFIFRGFEYSFMNPDILSIYGKEDWQPIQSASFELVN